MTALIIAEHDNVALRPATLTTVTAAMSLSIPIHLLVAGHQCGGVVDAAARIAGIERVIYVDAEHYRDQLAEELTPLITSMAADYTHLLAPATTFGKDLMPRIAAVLDVAIVSDVIGIEYADIFIRPIYAGNAWATVQATDPIKVLTVRTTAFAQAKTGNKPAVIEQQEALPVAGLSTLVEQKLTGSIRPELTVAKVIVSGGRGLGSAEHFHLLEKIADRLGGAVGGSRAAVDAGYIPNDYQIGQTGKIVAPDLYIAVGISGAIQHLAGMKDSRVIVAINKDADAPIFEAADYGLVGDLFKVLPEFLSALEKS